MNVEQLDRQEVRTVVYGRARQALAPALRCAACGKPVTMDGERIVRACDCNAAVIADIAARMAGSGGLR